ncbi:MAG: signal peptidase I [Actinobacteria bacterium]|nr:signal peptidase I [Actinomycetota bacterium]
MRSSPRWKLVRNVASTVLVLAVVAGWFHWFMPQKLGGRASWVLVSGKSMLPVYKTGDLVLVERESAYHVGQVIAYKVPKGDPMAGLQVIHRIVGGDAVHGFVTQGDNRTAPDVWRPHPQDIVGAKFLRIPYGVLAINTLRSPLMLGLLAACFVFVYVFTSGRKEEDDEHEEPSDLGKAAA